jgi:hypothetical protein
MMPPSVRCEKVGSSAISKRLLHAASWAPMGECTGRA